VRPAGEVSDLQGLGRHDHVCWFYDDVSDYAASAREFLLDGLARGERLLCVGDVAIRSATEGPAALPDAAELLRTGQLHLLPIGAVYAAGSERRSVAEQLHFYSRAVDRALEDGYAGLRVAAEVTELAGDADHLAWEQAADRFIVAGPGMATMCAYRVGVLGDELRDRLLQVHPLAGGRAPAAGFRLYCDEGALVLRGEVDSFSAGELADVLATSPRPSGVLILDADGLAFIDAAGTRVLAAWRDALRAGGVELTLRNPPRVLRRVWQTLELGPPPFA